MHGKQTKAPNAREERIKNKLKELDGKRTENDIFNTRLERVKGLYSSGNVFSFKSALKLLKRVETPTAKNETTPLEIEQTVEEDASMVITGATPLVEVAVGV